ncbi:MAG: YihY/virulence factor BrkB family protein [Haloferacaceae archaeon]
MTVSGTTTIAAVVAIAREKRITVNAASLAFYAANTLVALVILAYATFAVAGTGNVLARTLELLTGVGATEFQRLFERMGGTAAGRRRAVGLAVVISVWSSLRLFGAVESAVTDVYGTRKERSPLRTVVDAVLVLVAVTLIVGAMVVAGSLFLFRTAGGTGRLLGPVVLWLALVVLFAPVYYGLSGSDVSVGEVVPGTVVAATGWTVSAGALRLYVTPSESVDLYGIVGAVLLVLTWLYVVGLSVLVGVVANAYLAGRIEADREWYPLGE